MDEPVRINTRISARANKWLDKKAEEMALTKSGLINLAIENYIKETEVVQGIPLILDELKKHGIKIEL